MNVPEPLFTPKIPRRHACIIQPCPIPKRSLIFQKKPQILTFFRKYKGVDGPGLLRPVPKEHIFWFAWRLTPNSNMFIDSQDPKIGLFIYPPPPPLIRPNNLNKIYTESPVISNFCTSCVPGHRSAIFGTVHSHSRIK